MDRWPWSAPATRSCWTSRPAASTSTSRRTSSPGAARAGRGRRPGRSARGWERLYVDHVMQADTGADLDFLVGSSGHRVTRESH